jgi:hypothetical protein
MTSADFSGAGSYDIATTDSPFSIPLDNFVGVHRDDSMTMWLMFKPDGGQWVPLHKVSWRWSGAGQLSDSGWSSTANPPPSTSNNEETMFHPQWTTNVTAFFPK